MCYIIYFKKLPQDSQKSFESYPPFRIMVRMIKLRFSSLLFIFFLCFSSFILGWFVAIYIVPGDLLQKKVMEKSQSIHSFVGSDKKNPLTKNEAKRAEIETNKTIPFFEEMRDNILLLFDPYKMDSLMRKNTYLEEKGNYIKDKKKILVKTPFPFSATLNDKNNKDSSQKMNQPKASSDSSSLEEIAPLEPHFKTREEQNDEILQKLQAKYDEKNREQLLQILGDQKFFIMEGKFSFLINVFSEEEKALDYVKKMKEDYPVWSFLIKAYKDHIRIYLGPFKSKGKALEFKKMISQPSPFSQEFLEEISL